MKARHVTSSIADLLTGVRDILRTIRRIGPCSIVIVIAACGGGDQSDDDQRKDTTPTTQAASFFPPGAVPSDANLKGMWSPLYNWPLISVHTVLLPDQRVLTFGTNADGQQTGKFIYSLWDGTGSPETGHYTLINGSGIDLFCTSPLLLPGTGTLTMAGGDIWSSATNTTTNVGNNNSTLFDPLTNQMSRGPDMHRGRWYATSTMLLDGQIYIQGGSGGGEDRPEVRQLDGSYRLLSNVDTSTFHYYYPRNWLAPNGKVFGYESFGRMYSIDPAGTGTITLLGTLPAPIGGETASAAMFRPGRILQFGGMSNSALVIDINGAAPVVTSTQSMSTQRSWVNATVLADGKVLATGGSQVTNQFVGVNNTAEIWDPQTGQWTVGSAGAVARLYHSTALLLPDASVLISGGGAPGPLVNTNAEIYYPPYFFAANGQRAPRPTILSAPTSLSIGETFNVEVGNTTAVSRITLLKLGSVTHSLNMDQRFLDLPFTASGTQVSVQAPTRAVDATPGYYMLFAFNQNGVPSVASMLRIGVAQGPDPGIVPSVTPPSNQNSTTSTAVNLQLLGTDPNGDSLTWRSTGLPPGLTLDAQTGLITGFANLAGSYDVTVSATDGVNTSSHSFVWVVTGPVPLVLGTAPVPVAALSGSTVSYTASATGSSVQYRWNFGDGSAQTAYSSSPTITHVFAQPGSYTVTLTAIDSSNVVRSRSFQQLIHLPKTAASPSASTNVLAETSSGGVPRLWIVNQDNNSVSVFNTQLNTKLAEIPVGLAPRTIARAANGQLWVTNKLSSSLSVIDGTSLAVVRTIALPRASMPFGVAMSPSGDAAYVALEATGQLLKFNTSTYAQSGALTIGANVRHVSVASDGASVYVSRFITPPQPGESTATVAPTPSTGGQVVVVSSGMSLLRTIVLHNSTVADGENQGRGIPNYLGAVAISPDGSQAWVPSKQDNLQRGSLRDGNPLNFQSTVRAVSSRIVLGTQQEDLAKRIDHDNASVASAALYDPRGVYLFVALETSREVAVVDAHGGYQVARFDVGRAPQGLTLSSDASTLFVNNFMDRTVAAYDLRPLLERGEMVFPLLRTFSAVIEEKLPLSQLVGKQLFYDARDTRLARDRYISCASCHNDGGHDGRTWDFTSLGEGLRNTPRLRGRHGAQGPLHWSANFDEVQDFEQQIRSLAGGSGLLSGALSPALGTPKAGLNSDLDALAAYVGSLSSADPSPLRMADGALTAVAVQGKAVFQAQNCMQCHGGKDFTRSGSIVPIDIGTLKPSSGQRAGAALSYIDVPTLRDVWATAPYLHDGSAATLQEAILSHNNVTISAGDLTSLVRYLSEIGSDETAAPDNGGGGLLTEYFGNKTLTGTPVELTTGAVNLDVGFGAPNPLLPVDGFGARWSGTAEAPVSGMYSFQALSDDGVRVWIQGVLMIDDWTNHGPVAFTSFEFYVAAGDRIPIIVEYYENVGGAQILLSWKLPGSTPFTAIPATSLYAPVNAAAAGDGTGLSASYYNNVTLTGDPVATRVEAINFAWSGSPAAGVSADGFSARWAGTLKAPLTGSYTLQTESNDGVRVWVGTSLVIDNWTSHSSATNQSAPIPLAYGQSYDIRVEHYDNVGDATIRLRWLTPSSSSFVPVPASVLHPLTTTPPGSGTGLSASYYNNITLAGAPALSRTENIDFAWGAAAPSPAVAADGFSARWNGEIEAPVAGTYSLQTLSDDGVRVWVDGTLVIDNWTNHGPVVDTSANLSWTAGQRHTLRVEYYENVGGADMHLRWLVPGTGAHVAVPTTALYPPAGAPPGGNGTGLYGSYFNTMTLTGAAVLTRTEAVDTDWGVASPGTGVNADGFSVRWTGRIEAPTAGSYTLQTISDDGIRVWVDDVLLIDNWTNHGPMTDNSIPLTWTAGQQHSVRIEYYENGGGATARFRWMTPGTGSFVDVPAGALYPEVPGAGTGLSGSYFNNMALTAPAVLQRTEAVDFNWGMAAPAAAVSPDGYSVRWTGSVLASTTGSHRFQTVSDDGVRLWVNGQLLVDNWTNHGESIDTSVGVMLTAGTRYLIVMEYFENAGGAVARLQWQPPGAAVFTSIPAASLYPP
jgi:YVTN family beta-propeller protein